MAGKMVLDGIVARGLGEGTYFMSMQHYQKEIKKKLGFKAYPGTLNLKADKKQIGLLKNAKSVVIEGFKKNNKTFGGASCYRAKIKNIKGAIIVPELTRHKNVIEIIAPVYLKSALKIKDGDKVKIEIVD